MSRKAPRSPGRLVFILLVGGLILGIRTVPADTNDAAFVTVTGTHFEIDGDPYYFTGTNLWYGLNLASAGPGGDRARLDRELDRLAALGITCLTVIAGTEGPDMEPWRMIPALQTSPGVYDAAVQDGLDYLVAAMGARGLRCVMCLSNFWSWSGGLAQYVNWFGGGAIPYPPPEPGGDWNAYGNYTSTFYGNAGATAAYLAHFDHLATRTNPYTGLAYRDDPTIMAWELGNELRAYDGSGAAMDAWIDVAAGHIKSVDPDHLVCTGCEGDTPWPAWHGLDFESNHDGPDIDFATIHIWPQNWSWYDPADPEETYAGAEASARSYFTDHAARAAALDKPLLLQEFGLARDGGSFDPASTTAWRDQFYGAMYDEVYASASGGGPAVGAMFWAWAGEGRPWTPYGSHWQVGDPWIGDPPHEQQGWYSVYEDDVGTAAVVAGHAAQMNALAPSPPGPVIGLHAEPGHERVTVVWIAPDDPDLAAFHVYRGLWHDGAGATVYPEYDDAPGNTIPVRPVDRAAAESAEAWVLAGTVPSSAQSFADEPGSGVLPRGIYYYEVFAEDLTGQFGPPAAAGTRATNYWLGDVSGDGSIDPGTDINVLSLTYGLDDGEPGYDAHCDVGPTDDWSGTGIPLTDDRVGFADLMIFAQNYDMAAPRLPVAAAATTARLTWRRTAPGRWTLRLAAACPVLKGVRLRADLPDGATPRVSGGDLLDRQAGDVFLQEVGLGGLDAHLAVLGRGVGLTGVGDLLTVALPGAGVVGPPRLDLRDLDNASLDYELATEPDDASPGVRLHGNHPNPFNLRTEIAFELPAPTRVTLGIYDVGGKRVRTLLADAPKPKGHHRIGWDGTDGAGRSCPSGIYVYRLEAGGRLATRRMMLVK